MGGRTDFGEIITDTIKLRKVYDERVPKYNRLVDLIKLILTAAIDKKKMRLHSIKSRVKKYESFLEKVARKRYADPFRECTDLAGIRIVCLFNSQIDVIKEIINNEFKVIEITDKLSNKKFDQFGYLSLHMLVEIPKNRAKFTEYFGLEGLVCEIQIRTILQEAWAEIEHYLNYKTTKEEKDKKLLRKIFSLAGTLEVADSTFEEIHSEFSDLVKKKITRSNNLTPLTLFKFSKEYFSWYDSEYDKKEERNYFRLSKEVENLNLKSLAKLKKILDKHSDDMKNYDDYHRKKEKKTRYKDSYFSPVGLMRAALALEYGKKYDLVFGMKNYSDRVKKEIEMVE